MDHLPDDVLLSVMSRLDLPDLFSCRLVCKRFASLALHPDVWRDRCLPEPFCPAELYNLWFCPVLRLAPCLALLTIGLPSNRSCHPVFTSACASMRLDIYVFEGGAAHAALLIRHQRELGRLKGVELHFQEVPSEVDAPLLFQTLAATPGLDYLEIDLQCDELPLGCCPRSLQLTAPASASLELFTCTLVPSLAHFFNFMLAVHAATLQEVCIVNYEDVPAPSTTALLLAQMPNLTYLQCPAFPEMQALAACASLRSLCLEIYPYESRVKAAAALLRRAYQLTKVDLRHVCFDPDEQDPVGVELITALASSGRSGVEVLRIDYDGYDIEARLPELLSALPMMPALRRLKVNMEKDSPHAQKLLAATSCSLQVEFK